MVASALLPEDENATVEDTFASPSALALAKENGWIDWTPPVAGGSRSNFLKEPLARLYEERIAAAFSASEEQERQAKSQEMKEVRRLRGQGHAEELKLRKRSIESQKSSDSNEGGRRSGWRDERPMSDWDLVISRLARSSKQSSATSDAAPRQLTMISSVDLEKELAVVDGRSTPETAVSALSVPQHRYDKYTPSVPSSVSSSSTSPRMRPLPPSPFNLNFASASVSPPTSSGIPSVYDIHPALRSQMHSRDMSSDSRTTYSSSSASEAALSRASMQHPAQTQLTYAPGADLAANSADRAVSRIVEMGFTVDQAKRALRVTDMGDGLRVDRAIEMLLRESER